MKKIKYNKLKIQNFLSIGNDTIEIEFQKGLNQITGKNLDTDDRANAVGKSCVMSAHFFALFGETVNKIKSDFVVNNVTKGKGLIELTFDVETTLGTKSYTIKRQVKPSKVELWEGNTDITRDSIANTNKYICDLLSTNPNIHRCCDIMTVRDTTPFMEMKPEDKKSFIESIFSINVFGIMLKDLKKVITETKKDKDISSTKLSEIDKSLDTIVNQKNIIIKQIEERDIILQKRKDDLTTKINVAKKELSNIIIKDTDKAVNNLKKLEKAIKDVESTISDNQINISHIGFQISGLKSEIQKLSTIDGGIECEKCLQSIPHTHIELLNERKDACDTSLDDYIDKLSSAKTELEKNKKNKNILEIKYNEIYKELMQINSDKVRKENIQKTLDQLLESERELSTDIDSTLLSIASFDANIHQIEDRLNEETKILADLQQKLSDYDICKFILGEEGVKSFVVKKLLDLLNNTIEKYLIDLGLTVRVKFDEYFEEIITSDGKIISYKNASGAEKKSLDFACVFSFSDMRQKINQVVSNVEFQDETLDSAVDPVGLELIIKIIKDRIERNNTCVYLISHRKEVKDKIDGDIIMLEKHNKITRRVMV